MSSLRWCFRHTDADYLIKVVFSETNWIVYRVKGFIIIKCKAFSFLQKLCCQHQNRWINVGLCGAKPLLMFCICERSLLAKDVVPILCFRGEVRRKYLFYALITSL